MFTVRLKQALCTEKRIADEHKLISLLTWQAMDLQVVLPTFLAR